MPPKPKINITDIQSDISEVSDAPAVVNEEENYLDKTVSEQIELEKLKTLKEYNKTLAQNNNERKKYGGWIFLLTCVWAFLIFVIMFLQGFKIMFLSEKVLITLITSTTINFFGFFLLVVKYLFNTNRTQDKVNKAIAKAKKSQELH